MLHMNNSGSLPPKDDSHQAWLNLPTGSAEEDKNVFSHLAPPPKLSHPLGTQEGHPESCHEQTTFFIYKGTYIQHILTVLLLGLEKKIF